MTVRALKIEIYKIWPKTYSVTVFIISFISTIDQNWGKDSTQEGTSK